MKQLALAVLLTLAIAPSVHRDNPHELGFGMLNGQVFAVSEAGNFHPARSGTGYLISCETPKVMISKINHQFDAPNACAYLLSQLTRNRTAGFLEYSDTLSALLATMMYVQLTHVYEVPFQVDAQGFFSVSTVPGNYIVYVDGLAGGHRCIWMLSGVQVGKTLVSIKLSPSAIVKSGGNEDLRRPSLRKL